MDVSRFLIKPFVSLIRDYQQFISTANPNKWKYNTYYYHYTLEALQKHGFLKGSWLAAKRIASCNPWGGNGHDPVPWNVF